MQLNLKPPRVRQQHRALGVLSIDVPAARKDGSGELLAAYKDHKARRTSESLMLCAAVLLEELKDLPQAHQSPCTSPTRILNSSRECVPASCQ